jgi:RNA recognition motif-containing protein
MFPSQRTKLEDSFISNLWFSIYICHDSYSIYLKFASNDIAQTVIHKLNGLDLGGFRLVVDLLSNQAEQIINLFEQLCATTTTITSSNKNDPRLANATIPQNPQQSTVTLESTNPLPSNTTINPNNKEERESISNAVASLPPAQVS